MEADEFLRWANEYATSLSKTVEYWGYTSLLLIVVFMAGIGLWLWRYVERSGKIYLHPSTTPSKIWAAILVVLAVRIVHHGTDAAKIFFSF